MRAEDRHIPRYDLIDMSASEFQCLGNIIEFYLKHRTTDTTAMEMTARKLRSIIFSKLQTEPDLE
jgi:hypothetical protein